MQYGHCVVNATDNAINSLYFTGIAPAAIAALSNAQNAFMPSGALASIVFSFPRFFMSYTKHLLRWSSIIRYFVECARLNFLLIRCCPRVPHPLVCKGAGVEWSDPL